jgi:glycosyltransferase involved in cell wall biosynthesis
MSIVTISGTKGEVRTDLPAHHYLTTERTALPENFAERTVILERLKDTWLEVLLRFFKAASMAERVKQARGALRLFRLAPSYDAVITCGILEGFLFAALQRMRGRRRSVHLMYDCLWYGGNRFKRAWMKYCLREVDCCVVWASVEVDRYSACYGVDRHKFLFIPHHHTTQRFRFDVGDGGYVFAGGNWSRDYRLFLKSALTMDFPCIIATNRGKELLGSINIPQHVRVVAATHEEFRQLIARSSIVVLPMEAQHLHAGGQQTFLNAMFMGKPVILTDPEGGRDYIQDGVNGRLIRYGDKEQLTTAIRELMTNPELRFSMGEAARRFAAPLTTEACNTRIWAEVERLIKERQQELNDTAEGV